MAKAAAKTTEPASTKEYRPEFEGQLVLLSRSIVDALNSMAPARILGLKFSTTFAPLARQEVFAFETVGWDSTQFFDEHWGKIQFNALKNGITLELASFKIIERVSRHNGGSDNVLAHNKTDFKVIDGGKDLPKLVDKILQETASVAVLNFNIPQKEADGLTKLGKQILMQMSKRRRRRSGREPDAEKEPNIGGKDKFMDDVIAAMHEKYPALSPMQMVKMVAKEILGPVPAWSNRPNKDWLIIPVTPAMPTAAVIALFRDEETGEVMTVLQRKPGSLLRCLSGGGFQNVDRTDETDFYPASKIGEQPKQAASREVGEEIVDDKGKSIIKLDPARLVQVPDGGGNDYRAVESGRSEVPCSYITYYVWLDNDEAKAIKAHVVRLQSDPDYQQASYLASDKETHDVQIMPLSVAASMPEQSFAHPQEWRTLHTLQEHLTAKIPALAVNRNLPSLRAA